MKDFESLTVISVEDCCNVSPAYPENDQQLKTFSVTIVTSVPWDMGTITAWKMRYGRNSFFSSSTEAFYNHNV